MERSFTGVKSIKDDTTEKPNTNTATRVRRENKVEVEVLDLDHQRTESRCELVGQSEILNDGESSKE